MTHSRRRWAAAQALALLLLAGNGDPIRPHEHRTDPEATLAKRLYFVPLGEPTTPSPDSLAAHFRTKYGIPIEVLLLIELDYSLMDFGRRQFAAQDLLGLIKTTYADLVEDPQAILIGITPYDMYTRDRNWWFAFAWREDDRFAVVSGARMDPVFFGKAPNDSLLGARLGKMVAKSIGILFYDLEVNDNPSSVLYGSVMGLEELEHPPDRFHALADPRGGRRAVSLPIPRCELRGAPVSEPLERVEAAPNVSDGGL